MGAAHKPMAAVRAPPEHRCAQNLIGMFFETRPSQDRRMLSVANDDR